MKKALALIMSVVFALSLASCGDVSTRDEATSSETTNVSAVKPVINLYALASAEKIANIVRDQLTKAGFDVTIKLQPDWGSYKTQLDALAFDVGLGNSGISTASPDYAVRGGFKSDGATNFGGIKDPYIDEMIELAAAQTEEEYEYTYAELEKYIVEEKAYIVPLYRTIKTQAVNIEILKPETVHISQSRLLTFEAMEFQDSSRNETDPIILCQPLSDLTSLDPIKGNDGSITQIVTNMYVRLLNLTDNDMITTYGSLSYQYSIADGNMEYYFVIRDDINFAKVENMEAVDTGVRVGGEDVVFSLNRAVDGNSVPNHITYSVHETMEKAEMITDLSELKNIMGTNGKSILDELEENAPVAISTLTDDKTQVNNAEGIFQVIKVTTKVPFPQVLNNLTHQSAGIVCKDQVESVNTYDLANFDITKDITYGDQSQITEGPTYNNHLWASGPYIVTSKTDYGVSLVRNPGYMPTTEHYGVVKNFIMRFIADADAQFAALRAGEVYMLYSVPEARISIVKDDPKLLLQESPSSLTYYAWFNVQTSIFADEDLRKAFLYAINQDEIIAVYENRVIRCYSTMSPTIPNHNVHVTDLAKSAEHIAAWAARQK